MRYAGIDIGKDEHVAFLIGDDGTPLGKPFKVANDAHHYARLFEWLGACDDVLVVVEATGHYSKNLVGHLIGHGYAVAVLNPLRAKRFAQEEMSRAKTDAADAQRLALMGLQKGLAPTRLPDRDLEEFRELVQLRARYVQDKEERVLRLGRMVDLVFPEFPRHLSIDTLCATAILRAYPTADAIAHARKSVLARLLWDDHHRVGLELAGTLIEAAKVSVGLHQGEIYRMQIRDLCEDIEMLRGRIRRLDRDIERKVDDDEVARLLTTIGGVGVTTASVLVSVLGDPASFDSPEALASYVGVVPAINRSGKRNPLRAPISGLGNARLRHALWGAVMAAVRPNVNPWLADFYQRLLARGKPRKVGLIAVMRKLLHAVYAVARDRKPFVPRLTEARP